ncbi:MAG: bifunctional 5,10-methylenetetrahydrofolate dehydrogenase/5,10-methenyltetrahydrofolate cyclohydrolase [bacterium]
MGATIIEGKALSASILSSLPERARIVSAVKGRPPSLAVVKACDDPATLIYIRRKLAACENAGITTRVITPDAGNAEKFIETIRELGRDPDTDAVMIERPLPAGFNGLRTWEELPPGKDPDGSSALNMGRLFLCKNFREIEDGDFFTPCTAMAVIRLMKQHGIAPAGKPVAVIGRSPTVGRPLAHMLSCMDATVTLCHSRTSRIEEILKSSRIIVTAVGKARWLTASMVSADTVVLDVGTNTDETGNLCGDSDFENLETKIAAISPVPGGVGPVTLALLLENTIKAAEKTGGG